MKYSYSQALVTGGAGFIGSHIVDRLLEKEIEVTAFDNLATGSLENIKVHERNRAFNFLKGDIRDANMVRRAIRDIDVVFHEAAFVGTLQSVKEPLLTNDVNVNGTLTLLEAAVKSDVKRLVFASSAAVYGEQKHMPINEGALPIPNSPYAASKLAAEAYVTAYMRAFGLNSTCLRYFNVYGQRQNSFYGTAISAFAECLFRNRPPVVYGDGKQTRDFVNIKDVVDVNILAMEKSCPGEILNVATGSSIAIDKLLKILQKKLLTKPLVGVILLSM